MEIGSKKLRKIIKQLLARGLPSGLMVSHLGPALVRIEKYTDGSEKQTEFAFTIRVEKSEGAECWWPIEYLGSNGEQIRSEVCVNGRTLTNLQKQTALVELADTWARTLEAQLVTQTVGNALL
ncbi:hypothetical protein WDW37_21650 [Bdellovibrionota bacterium FG-1]